MAFGFDNVTKRPYNDDHDAAEINAAHKRAVMVPKKKLDVFIEAMADDSLTLEDAELRAELQAEGVNPATVIGRMRESVAALIVEAGKARAKGS